MDIPQWSVLLWWVTSYSHIKCNYTSVIANCYLLWYSLGNEAPYHITQPSTDNDVQIVSPTATMATLTCSLNVTIPSSMIIIWSRNSSLIGTDGVSTAGKSTTLVIEKFEPSDAGNYECQFNNPINNGWTLRRTIRLLITSMFLYRKII